MAMYRPMRSISSVILSSAKQWSYFPAKKKLLEFLNSEDTSLLEKYMDAQGEVNGLTAVKNLIYGYKLGLLMTAEAFIGMDELIDGIETQ